MGLETILEKIKNNNLPIDIETYITIHEKYKLAYTDSSDIEIFYKYVQNTVGSYINSIEPELVELLGWLKIKNKENVYYFQFEDSECYLNWLEARKYIYSSITDIKELRLLNYLEISTIDFVIDYNLKETYLIDDNSIQQLTVSELGKLFNKNQTFKLHENEQQ